MQRAQAQSAGGGGARVDVSFQVCSDSCQIKYCRDPKVSFTGARVEDILESACWTF